MVMISGEERTMKMKFLHIQLLLYMVLIVLMMSAAVFPVSVSYAGCSEVFETDLAEKVIAVRMKGISGSFTVDNAGGTSGAFTVTVRNVDPDYVTVSQGTVTDKGSNSFVMSLTVPVNTSATVTVKPWYLNSNDFYFLAWSDNQDNPAGFENKLLAKTALIDPLFAVSAGDIFRGTPPQIGGSQTPNQYTGNNEYMKDYHYTNTTTTAKGYMNLIRNYPLPIFEVPGNHDLSRGGATNNDDSRYDEGQRLWRKYLGAIDFSFDVGNTHFIMLNFHYDMPNWTSRWGNQDAGYLSLGTAGYPTATANDDVGLNLKNWISSDLTAAAGKANRITVFHHPLSRFTGSPVNTVNATRALFVEKNVDYIINGHAHSYATGTDSGIKYLLTGDASSANPGFSLVHVSGTNISQQHMYADTLALSVAHQYANDGTQTNGLAVVSCSGYGLPYIRVKFRLSKNHGTYTAKSTNTGQSETVYCRQFSDYTVCYVETSIANGQTKYIKLTPSADAAPVVSGAPASATTNKSFTVTLDVDKNYGYFSTNGSAYVQFTTAGASVLISGTTTLAYYGRDTLSNNSTTNTRTYTFDTSAPAVSGAPANVTTNAQFTLSLDVNENYGYFSTNGSAYVQFTTAGTNILISRTTTLSYYGRDAVGNMSATNTKTYTFDTTAPVVSGVPASMTTNNQFGISLDVNENYGYFSTNGSAYVQFTTAGTNVLINRTTTLSYYGRDAFGNTSVTNTRAYTIGLVAHWKFDEAAGTSAADASGYGHTAYLSNMTAPSCWGAGKFGNALSFDNTDDYIKAAGTSALSAIGSNNADLSVSFFIRLSSGWNGTWRHVMHKGNTLSERTFAMFLNPSNNRLHYRISTTSNYSEGGDSASEIPLGTWVHVAYVKQGNVLAVYFNGVKNSSVTLRGAVINNNGPVYIGRDPQQAGAAMTLDDVRVYNRALGSNEIASIAAAGGTTTVLAAVPVGKVTGGSAQIDPLVKNVGLSYTVGDTASPASTLTAMTAPTGMAIDDGEETSAYDIEMQFSFAPAGTTDWCDIDSASIDGSTVHAVIGGYRNTWRLPADADLSKRYDVRIGGSRGGIPLTPYVVTNVDITRIVAVRSALDGYFALNNPCRGAGVITFANLTEDATVTVYSVSGKKIAQLSPAVRNENGILSWNVASDDGRRVQPGVYLCRATSSAGSKTIRVMVLK